MKKDRLKPYVQKVNGAVNYALYDLMSGRFFHLKPEGDIPTLRASLQDAGLIFVTEGDVPFKIEIDITADTKNIRIRELQIKLNGCKEDTCWQRNILTERSAVMDIEVLEALEQHLTHLPVDKVRIEAGKTDRRMIGNIVERFKCRLIELYVMQDIDKETIDRFKRICSDRSIHFILPAKRKKVIDKLNVERVRNAMLAVTAVYPP